MAVGEEAEKATTTSICAVNFLCPSAEPGALTSQMAREDTRMKVCRYKLTVKRERRRWYVFAPAPRKASSTPFIDIFSSKRTQTRPREERRWSSLPAGNPNTKFPRV
ncbi:hypothetical protein COCNU_04G000280 [Cocos nucifera]|uniref:Uncharacterized protein n=1 Tax=Cocos nucifera TaxID=13894 RepID=A0A8K0I4W3_COCNU|nr:hypothetical protein COCNU_04G000280 [Cocos nucifera]